MGFSRQRRLSPFGLKCSAEVNSACAEVLPAAKRSYGAAGQKAGWAVFHLLISILTVPCGNEFRLRRGFACGKTLVQRKGGAAQKAD